MRIRTIKPEVWDDEKLCRLPFGARLLFIGTWNLADDYGIVRSNPAYMKSKLFAYDESLRAQEVNDWLDALVNARMLIPLTYNGEGYYKIRTFCAHQVINRPGKRTIPKHEEERQVNAYLGIETENAENIHGTFSEDSRNIHGTLTEDSQQERKGKERKGKEQGEESFSHTSFSWQEIKNLMRESSLIPESLERREKIPREKISELLESFFLRCESTAHDERRTFRDVATHFDAWASKYWREQKSQTSPGVRLKPERTM